MESKNNFLFNLGEKTGFALNIFLFVSVLYIILSILRKLPAGFYYWHFLIFAIILFVTRLIYQKIKK
jgi:uncharacterized membrane protein